MGLPENQTFLFPLKEGKSQQGEGRGPRFVQLNSPHIVAIADGHKRGVVLKILQIRGVVGGVVGHVPRRSAQKQKVAYHLRDEL